MSDERKYGGCTAEQLAALEQTERPWVYGPCKDHANVPMANCWTLRAGGWPITGRKDFELAAAAVNALPDMLARIAELEAEDAEATALYRQERKHFEAYKVQVNQEIETQAERVTRLEAETAALREKAAGLEAALRGVAEIVPLGEQIWLNEEDSQWEFANSNPYPNEKDLNEPEDERWEMVADVHAAITAHGGALAAHDASKDAEIARLRAALGPFANEENWELSSEQPGFWTFGNDEGYPIVEPPHEAVKAALEGGAA